MNEICEELPSKNAELYHLKKAKTIKVAKALCAVSKLYYRPDYRKFPYTGCLLAFVFFQPLSTDYNTCSMMAGLDLFYSKHLSFWDFRIKSTKISSKWQNFVL